MKKFEPRDYQTEISGKASRIPKDKGIVYLAMEVRTGKTFTALMAAHGYGAKSVLFLPQAKAVNDNWLWIVRMGPENMTLKS